MNELASTLNAIPHPTIVIDKLGTIEMCNDRFLKAIDLEQGALKGRSFTDVLREITPSTEQWRSGEPAIDQMLESTATRPIRIETDIFGTVDLRITPFQGKRYLVTVVAQNGDDLALFHRSQRQNQRVIDALITLGDAGVFLIDAEYRIIDFNDVAVQFTTIHEEHRNLLSASPISKILRLYQDESTFGLDQAIQRSVGAKQRRDFSLSADISGVGERTDVALSIIPITPEAVAGEVLAAISIEDVSERKKIRRELQNLQHAEDICRAATGIAHELNNNATAMISILGRIEREVGETDKETREDFVQLQSALRRVRRLGVQLERFAWRESGLNVEEERWISGDHLEEIVHETTPLATGGTNIRTTFSLDPVLPAVTIPASELTQAFFNVVLNAVEAMNEGGTLRIEVRHQPGEGYCTIVVGDDGTGLDPLLLRKAFQPYFSTKSHGIGMGLTVALSIIESYGGHLELETEPGFGTTARFHLPVYTLHHGVGSDESANGTERIVDYREKRVLLVEDDPLVRRSMEMMIRNLGCDVVAVHSGERAITVFQQEYEDNRRFDALVTDFAMPGRVNGVQLVGRLREFDPELPAVLSSGALHRNNAIGYREAGFQFVLRKPFGDHEIKEALATVL